jgi:hypothetical protein
VTVRLCGLALARWADLDGHAAAHNLPELHEMPLGRFCNLVWWFFTNGGDGAAIEKFRARLWRPPVGEKAPSNSPWSPENEQKGFAALKAALGAK